MCIAIDDVMVDHVTPKKRSEIMRAVRSKNTRPELIVRRELFRLGFRYRLHVATLPGCPDIVFPRKKKVIFVHGCFWHGHTCKNGRLPKNNVEFWGDKIRRNVNRDIATKSALELTGWDVIVIWQCELRDSGFVENFIVEKLNK